MDLCGILTYILYESASTGKNKNPVVFNDDFSNKWKEQVLYIILIGNALLEWWHDNYFLKWKALVFNCVVFFSIYAMSFNVLRKLISEQLSFCLQWLCFPMYQTRFITNPALKNMEWLWMSVATPILLYFVVLKRVKTKTFQALYSWRFPFSLVVTSSCIR